MSDNAIITLQALDRSLAFAETVINAITDDRRDGPTPCQEFTVQSLTAHLVACTHWFAIIPDVGVADPSTVVDPDLAGKSLVEAFSAEASLTRQAWNLPMLEKELETPFGPMSGAHMTGYMIVELLGHGLDLAMATGQDIRPDDTLVELGLQIAMAMGDALRAPKMMGSEVPVNAEASLTGRFLGFIGRDPAWKPSA